MSVAVCADASALLPDGLARRDDVELVPIDVTLDGEPFDDRLGIDAFYERLSGGAQVATSLPSPGQLLEVYERAAARGARAVLSIHLDGRLSGTIGSAELAARDASLPVTVVDTRTVSYGVAVCVRAAVEAIDGGADAAEAAAVTLRLGAALRNVFVAGGGAEGRVPRAVGWTLLTVADGRTSPLADCVDIDDAVDRMCGTILASEEPVRVAVGHAARSTEAAADRLVVLLAEADRVLEVERYRVGASIGAHSGPRSFGAFVWPARLRESYAERLDA